MQRRLATASLAIAAAVAAFAVTPATRAADNKPFKIGFILPMTGQSASTGKQIDAAVKLWLAQNGSTVAGRKVEVIVKDDAGVADTTRRLAQELVVSEKVDVLAGFGLTPLAFATAPIATQSKTPMVVTAAATSAITEQSPYIVRTSFTLPQVSVSIAEWAAKNKIRNVVTFVADYGPGIDAEKFFKSQFQLNGGKITGEIRSPLRSPDFAPFLQKVADLKPDAVFCFLPSGQGAAFMKQFGERGPRQVGHQADRDRRRDRRRPAPGHGRRRAWRRHVAPLLGGAPVGGEPEVREGLRGGEQVPPQLHGGRGLRRHCASSRPRSRPPRAPAAATRCSPP